MKTIKHLCEEDRIYIENSLNADLTITQIARTIDKDPTTVSKEIKKHRVLKISHGTTGFYNTCKHVRSCTKMNICLSHDKCNNKLCKTCNICSSVCHDFEKNICKKLLRAPHVCNGCVNLSDCKMYIKYFYFASSAHKNYVSTLSSSRKGINMSEEQIHMIDELISPLIIDKNQPVNHIYASHRDEIGISKKTFYNYMDLGLFRCKNIDLPKKIKYKKRKNKKMRTQQTNDFKKDRNYDQYLQFIATHPDYNIIQMDTVEGVKGGKLLLTLHSVHHHFQISHLIPSKESKNVKIVFDLYKDNLDDDELFKRFFRVILTDNGSEFTDLLFLEEWGCHVFYCDPNRSDQKGACEKNHEYIRRFFSKGTPFDEYKQNQIWKMMSIINSIRRESLNNKSPYEVMQFIWGLKLLQAFNINYIDPDEVKIDISVLKKSK